VLERSCDAVFLCDRVPVVTSARVGTWRMEFFPPLGFLVVVVGFFYGGKPCFYRKQDVLPCCSVIQGKRIVLVTGVMCGVWCERLLVVNIVVVLLQCPFMWIICLCLASVLS